MRSRSRRRAELEKPCSSPARETNSGRRANPAATFCGFARYAWIATPMLSSCASKRSGRASVMKVTGVASSKSYRRTEAPRSLPSALSLPKRFMERRKLDEPAEAGNPQREPAGRDVRAFFACRLEDHAGFTKLRSGD